MLTGFSSLSHGPDLIDRELRLPNTEGSYFSNSWLLPLAERLTCHVPHDHKLWWDSQYSEAS